jgi:hypothetical protein
MSTLCRALLQCVHVRAMHGVQSKVAPENVANHTPVCPVRPGMSILLYSSIPTFFYLYLTLLFQPSFLPCFLPSFLPSSLSFLPAFLPFVPTFLISFFASFHPSFTSTLSSFLRLLHRSLDTFACRLRGCRLLPAQHDIICEEPRRVACGGSRHNRHNNGYGRNSTHFR